MHPRLSARHGGICPLSRLSVPGDDGAYTPASLLRGPLGGEVTTPAREYRIPPHQNDVS
jgi:hypothetical protein